MRDSVQIAGGPKRTIPRLPERFLGYCMDTKELYIGSRSGNVLLGANTWNSDINTLKTEKLTAQKAQTVTALPAEADLKTVTEKINEIISELRTAGIMK